LKPVPEGFEPAYVGPYADALEGRLGPIYYRKTDAGYELGLWVEAHHCNVRKVAHGGFMTAMSDMACGFTVTRHFRSPDALFVSVSLSHQFILAVPLGAWLSSECKIRKAGRSTLFLDCEHHVGSELVGTSQLVMKKTGPTANPSAPQR